MQIITMNGTETIQAQRTDALRYSVSSFAPSDPPRLQQAWSITVFRDGGPVRQDIEWRDVETVVVDDKR